MSLIPLPGNPTPGVALKNTSGTPVEVLGAAGEPFPRIGPNAVLANLRSPDWAFQSPGSDPGEPPPDASAAPDWIAVGTGSEYAFVLPRAGPTPSRLAELYALHSPTEVSRWSLPLLIGGQRVEVTGGTTLTPAEFTERPWLAPFLVGAGVVLMLVLALAVWLSRRRPAEGGC